MIYETVAAVDLGSNSFHCQIARVAGEQFFPLDSLREPVRLGAGLGKDKKLDDESQERALACLARFGERLRGFDPHGVRAIGTNTLRVAKNSKQFLRRARAALGFPIEVVAGREEARLLYLGVSHSLPASRDKRLVVDIGGGSTECIIGTGYKPLKLESLFMGCVSYSLRYFRDGRVTKSALKEADLAARAELEPIVSSYIRGNWQQAVGSSGTIRSLAEILHLCGHTDGPITLAGLDKLRSQLLRAGDMSAIDLPFLNRDLGWEFMRKYFQHRQLDLSGLAYGLMDLGLLPAGMESGSGLMRYLGLGHVAHTALEDARNTAIMYFKIIEKIKLLSKT